MARKKLKEKIELTIFWLGLFCLTYLIFGFILKSDLTKPVDSAVFYEVLKDALTITAAFFAPVAAFVLFSDWRVEHHIKATYQLLDDIKNLSFSIQNDLGQYHTKIVKKKINNSDEFVGSEDRQLILKKNIELERIGNQFLVLNKEIESFKLLVIKLKDCSNIALDDLHLMEYFTFNLINKKYLIDNDYYRSEYLKYSDLYDEKFLEICKISDEINNQVTNIKSKI